MRNILALVAAFTLSTTSTMSVLACNSTSDRGTTNVFDWNKAFKVAGGAGKTTSDFFNFLNSQGGQSWGKQLYSTINQHINLSILKNNSKYKSDYEAALITVNSQIENKIASLKAKFGRGWEKQWKKVLADYNNSVDQYRDDQLKDIATKVINNSYVNQNYGDYEYYTTSEIYPMLRDVFETIKNGKFKDVKEYIDAKTTYSSTIWIVIKANNSVGDDKTLTTAIKDVITADNDWNAVTVSNPVAKTVDDKENNEHISSTYNTVNGLLSANQAKIAQVMMTAQEPIWVRQIVIPFNSTDKDKALQKDIDEAQFSENKPKINEVVNDIKNLGFDQTFTNQGTTAPGTTDTTSDLGLININNATKDNTPFYYYLYRYVTSEEGIGKSVSEGIQPDILKEYVPDPNSKDRLHELLPDINHTNSDDKNITSQYNDLVYMQDKNSPTSILPDAQKNNGPGVGIFIDTAGIHFIETPGITYHHSVVNKSTYVIIQEFNKKKQNPPNLKWDDVASLADRPGGLSNSPYLDYLQTAFLLQKNRGNDTTVDLNKSLSDFTATSDDLGSPNWWDYNLFFDNNASLIHWNVSELTGSNPPIDDAAINAFAKSLQTWFNNVKNSRWDNKQALYVNAHFQNDVKMLNKAWDAFGINAPTARLNENISDYLTKVGKQTLWWYDQNIITNN